jgi:hypothetical protein
MRFGGLQGTGLRASFNVTIHSFRTESDCRRVKDHPQFSNGHKTRFWCSQDDAHRSKSSRAARKAQGDLYKPRQSSSGETLAKNRFPCRSRLLISSRDSGTPERPIVTVRMHHHVAHEPYVDLNLPPEVAQNVFDTYWTMKLSAGARPTTNGNDRTTNPPQPVHVQQSDERRRLRRTHPRNRRRLPIFIPNCQMIFLQKTILEATTFTQDHEPPPPSSHSTTPPTPTVPFQNAEMYHRRMLAHIRTLRDFCDGLEFQLQFNDYRMLEELEREGARFLDFVGDCLKKEGRPLVQQTRIPFRRLPTILPRTGWPMRINPPWLPYRCNSHSKQILMLIPALWLANHDFRVITGLPIALSVNSLSVWL